MSLEELLASLPPDDKRVLALRALPDGWRDGEGVKRILARGTLTVYDLDEVVRAAVSEDVHMLAD